MLSQNNRKAFRRRAAASAVGLFLIGALFGAYIILEVPIDFNSIFGGAVVQEPAETPENISVGTPREAVVAGDAEIDWIVRFSQCGHESAVDPPGSIAGMTRKEIAAAYPGYTVEIFDTEYVRMAKSVDGYCPEHYILTMGDEALVISRMDMETLSQKEVMRIITDTSSFDGEALSALENGIAFDSLEDINAYLEGAE